MIPTYGCSRPSGGLQLLDTSNTWSMGRKLAFEARISAGLTGNCSMIRWRQTARLA